MNMTQILTVYCSSNYHLNNSKFQIFLHFNRFENNMENGTFAPEEQMFHFSLYFKKYYISKASKSKGLSVNFEIMQRMHCKKK